MFPRKRKLANQLTKKAYDSTASSFVKQDPSCDCDEQTCASLAFAEVGTDDADVSSSVGRGIDMTF